MSRTQTCQSHYVCIGTHIVFTATESKHVVPCTSKRDRASYDNPSAVNKIPAKAKFVVLEHTPHTWWHQISAIAKFVVLKLTHTHADISMQSPFKLIPNPFLHPFHTLPHTTPFIASGMLSTPLFLQNAMQHSHVSFTTHLTASSLYTRHNVI